MSPSDVRSLAYQVYDAINAQDIAKLEALFDPGVIRHAVGQTGFEHAKTAVLETFKILPKNCFVVEDAVVEADKVALRVSIQGVPVPEGQQQPVILEIFRIEDGRVAEIWGAGTMRAPGT